MEEMQLKKTPTKLVLITIADSSVMASKSLCIALSWKMNNPKFKHDMRVLKLGSGDLILRMDWLKTYSPIMFGFQSLQMSFSKNGEEVKLKESKEGVKLKHMSEKSLQKKWYKMD